MTGAAPTPQPSAADGRRITLDDLPHLLSAELRRLVETWFSLRGAAESVPLRTRFDPLAVPQLLDRIWLCAFEPETERFVYRLAGERINSVYGRSLRGVDLRDMVPADSYPIVHRRYLAALEGPAVVHTSGRIYLHNERFDAGERLILPLADAEGRPAFVLGATVLATSWDYPSRDQMARDHLTTVTPVIDRGTPSWRQGFDGNPLD